MSKASRAAGSRHSQVAPVSAPTPSPRPLPAIGENVRQVRQQRGLSVRLLAGRSGVSKTMLSQIERGRSVPTVNLLWKIAQALDISLAALLAAPAADWPVILPAFGGEQIHNAAHTFTVRTLFPRTGHRRSEFYQLTLAPGWEEDVAPRAAGTSVNVVVASGDVEMVVGEITYRLFSGDALSFSAAVPHGYRNSGRIPAVLYQVITTSTASPGPPAGSEAPAPGPPARARLPPEHGHRESTGADPGARGARARHRDPAGQLRARRAGRRRVGAAGHRGTHV